MIDLSNISATLTERKWMRSAKAFRCLAELPNDSILAASMTALIDRQVNITLCGPDGLCVDMHPAQVVDVPGKGKRFSLVFETVYEHQNHVGTKLTAMTGEQVKIEISPITVSAPPEPTPKSDTIGPDALRGLHTSFFQNKLFWEYVSEQHDNINIQDQSMCKAAYKQMLGVESCKDITTDQYKTVLNGFNAWLSLKGSDGRG